MRSMRTMLSTVLVGAMVTVGLAAATIIAAPLPGASAATTVRDGLTDQTAGASCWGVKQDVPSSPDGVYWLQTPALVAPTQFYCDMTTDGGGWVLIGRGRDGWTWSQNGQGSVGDVQSNPTGFSPATLDDATVDGLLNGGSVSALTDGIRLRRATSADGTSYQEMRLFETNRPTWSWAFGGGLSMNKVQISGGSTYTGSFNTQTWSNNSQYNYMATAETSAHNYRKGFSFGTQISGNNSAASYLWTYANEKSALPFSQVFLRPQIASSSLAYPTIPQSGLPATAQRALASSTTSVNTPWGVTGIKGRVSELNMEVEAFAQVGNYMYVGGGFQYVQKGANPGPGQKIGQPWLAAFDVQNGEWLSSFRPQLDAMVWDLQAMPDGTLAVGGDFTNVNGVPNTHGLAELDPITGAVKPNWTASVDLLSTSIPGPAQVKALALSNGYLYIAGKFNRILGGNPVGTSITVGRAARVRVSDGKPDGTWKPNFDGTVVEMDVNASDDRVYMAGYFDQVNGVASARRGVVSTAAGAANIPGQGPYIRSQGANATYQQMIQTYGDNVWIGGSEHTLQKYDQATFTQQNAYITKQGGDFQASAIMNGVLYAGGHFGNYVYSDTNSYSNPLPSASNVHDIKYIGAWDATTGAFLPDFFPSALDTRSGIGPWALQPDTFGCMWFGGDFKQGSFQNSTNAYQWLGGFGKFCQRDSQAPTSPTNLTSQVSGSSVTLNWSASTDNSGIAPRYELMRGDRVVTNTNSLGFTDTAANLPANYWVRAIDGSGNRSATTAGVSVQAPDTKAPSVPTDLQVTGTTSSSITLSWSPSSDDTAVTGYRVARDGNVTATVTDTTFTDDGMAPSSSHTYTVAARDAAGNWSEGSVVANGQTAADTTPPNPATGVQATAATSGTDVSVIWKASTSDDVAGYQVVRDGAVVSSTLTGTSFADGGLTPSTEYSYVVRTVDTSNNTSDSGIAQVTTPSAPNNEDIFTDDFSGAGPGWSSTWTTSSDSVGSTATSGSGVGSLSMVDTASAYARAQLTGVPAAADQEILLSYQWNSSSAVAYNSVYLRGSGGWQNAYRPKTGYGVQFQSNSGTVALLKNTNGTLTTLASVSGARQVSTAKQWLRFRVDGSTVEFRTWVDGFPEPATWTSVQTDSGVTAAGQLFVSHVRGTSNAGTKTVNVDDLTLTTIHH